jgi:hypothetical protein
MAVNDWISWTKPWTSCRPQTGLGGIRVGMRPALRRWGAVLGRSRAARPNEQPHPRCSTSVTSACPPQPGSSTAARPRQWRLRRRMRWRKRHHRHLRPAEQRGSCDQGHGQVCGQVAAGRWDPASARLGPPAARQHARRHRATQVRVVRCAQWLRLLPTTLHNLGHVESGTAKHPRQLVPIPEGHAG